MDDQSRSKRSGTFTTFDAIAYQSILRSNGRKPFRCAVDQCGEEFSARYNGYRHVRTHHQHLYAQANNANNGVPEESDTGETHDEEFHLADSGQHDNPTGSVSQGPASEVADLSAEDYDTVLSSYFRRTHATDKDIELFGKLTALPVPAGYTFSKNRLIGTASDRVQVVTFCPTCQKAVADESNCCDCDAGAAG